MASRVVKRLFNINVRKTSKVSNSSEIEGKEVVETESLKTDNLIIYDAENNTGTLKEDQNNKVNTPKIFEDENVKEKTTRSYGQDVRKALASTFDILSSPLSSHSDKFKIQNASHESDNKSTQENILEGGNRNNTPLEQKQTETKLLGSKKKIDDITSTTDNILSTSFTPDEVSSNSQKIPYEEPKPPVSDKPVHPPQTDPEKSDSNTYQNHINTKKDLQVTGNEHHNIYQDYILERINEENPNKEEEKKKPKKNQSETDKDDIGNKLPDGFNVSSRFKPHLRPTASMKDYNSDDYNWFPLAQQKKKKNIPDILTCFTFRESNKWLEIPSMIGKPKTPELYAHHTNKFITNDRKITESAINFKRNLLTEPGQRTKNIESISAPPAINPVDTTTMPGYETKLGEKPVGAIAHTDFLKFVEPELVSSYDLVPGPSILKSIGSLRKHVSNLGTQSVSSLIHGMQYVTTLFDRSYEYPIMNPYYYLLNKYGPMVRLHGPLGADILVLAVNGQDFPIVHVKQKGGKYQSVFDSLNTYREETPSLEPILDFPTSWPSIPDNPSITIDQHYSVLEKITDEFIKEKRFIYGSSSLTENDNHENDLIRWALQCNLEVYFKSKKQCMADVHSSDTGYLVDCFIKASKYLSSCETGVQLWRTISTFSWLELVDNCKQFERFILDEVNECLSLVNKEMSSGAALETLLATEEIRGPDIFTSLLDLFLINVNIVASTTGFLLYNLGRTPQVQRTLFREISSVVKKGSTISYEDLQKMKYLNACILETLRLAPPFPVLKRLLDSETKIHKFLIPKGTYVHMFNILPYAKGSNGYSDVGKFQADRWTDKSTLLEGDPLAGLPQWNSFPKFNKDLVMAQIALLVAKVAREYRIEYPLKEIYPNGRVLQKPSNPFSFTFVERQI